MKISVIIAVAHMSMGIVVKGLNALYFKQKVVFWFEVVTGLIIIKWFYPMNPYSSLPGMVDKIN